MIFYNLFANSTYLLFSFFYGIKVVGLENLPKEGRVVICSNHVGFNDPILMTAIMPRKLTYMAKKELFKNKFLSAIITKLGAFPVDRETSGLGAIKTAIKILKSDKVFAMFPQGTRTKEEDLDSSKPGVAMIAVKSKSPVIPVYIDTEYKLFKKIHVTVGEIIDFSEYFDTKLTTEQYASLSKTILTEIYKLNK